MEYVRAAVSRLMTIGMLSAGWYSILTGVAFLYVAYLLGGVSGDSLAPFVAVAFALTGAWQLERGLRTEFQRRRQSTDERS